jgi:hypothetical protein
LKVEQEMSRYGMVASCSKDFVDIKGFRIENERRNVLFSMIFNKEAISNGELDMFGGSKFVRFTLHLYKQFKHLNFCLFISSANLADCSEVRLVVRPV